MIRDRFAAYITWEEFENNHQKLAENQTLGKMLAAPRHGPSVLSGLLVCGRCGHRMLVGYGNTGGASGKKSLRYSCQRDAIDYGDEKCQSLSGAVLESLVVERLLQAVSPASLELSLAATQDIEREPTTPGVVPATRRSLATTANAFPLRSRTGPTAVRSR